MLSINGVNGAQLGSFRGGWGHVGEIVVGVWGRFRGTCVEDLWDFRDTFGRCLGEFWWVWGRDLLTVSWRCGEANKAMNILKSIMTELTTFENKLDYNKTYTRTSLSHISTWTEASRLGKFTIGVIFA